MHKLNCFYDNLSLKLLRKRVKIGEKPLNALTFTDDKQFCAKTYEHCSYNILIRMNEILKINKIRD